MHLHSRHITSLAASLALVCSLTIAACAQRETTTAGDYAANQTAEQAEEDATQASEGAEEQVDEQAEAQASAEPEATDAPEAEDATTEKQVDEEKPPVLNTQMLMSAVSLKDKIVNGEVDKDVLNAIPDYEGDEYEALDAPEPSRIDDIADARSNAKGVLWYTSGIAIIAPDHWAATLGSDEIDFEGTKYDLTAFMRTWNRAQSAVSAVEATDCHIANLSEGGFYNIRYIDRGTITVGGAVHGSYAQILADFDWKGDTGTFVIDINYIEGKTKLSGLAFMTPAETYGIAKPDIDAVWNSLAYVSGEEF